MRRLFLLLFVFLCLPMLARCSTPVAGAAIQTWYHHNQMVTVRLLNTGDKTITAFILDLHITDANGTTETHWMRDFLNNAAFIERFIGTPDEARMRKEAGPVSLPPGASYDENIPVSASLKDFSATVEALAFSDNTASAVSQDAITPLIDQRKAMVASIDKATTLIRQSSTHAEAATAVEKTYTAWKITPHYGKLDLNSGELQSIAEDLKQLPPSSGEFLQRYIEQKQREQAIFAAQTKLTVTVGDAQ